MRNILIKRMFIILVINVLIVASGVYAIVFVTVGNAMTEDIRERAIGVKDYILENLDAEVFIDIGEDSPAGVQAGRRVQGLLDGLHGIGNLERLYIAKVIESGEIITSLRVLDIDGRDYVPTGVLEDDLRRSLDENVAVIGDGIHVTEDRRGIYTIFWPFSVNEGPPIGVVCMEFNVDAVYQSRQTAMLYGIVLSVALIVLFSIIAYLSMSGASEPYYKKLAYTDILTGYENRMAFEHHLRDCNELAKNGVRVTLIICDVNNLKTVNDVHGHKVGDLYLQTTANIIDDNIGGMGSLYRIGGDEFAILITGRSASEENKLLEVLLREQRDTVRGHRFSCASGMATYIPGTDTSMRDVFRRADEAMYAQKKKQKEDSLGYI